MILQKRSTCCAVSVDESSILEGFKTCFHINLLSFKYSFKRLLMDSEFLVATTVYSEFKGIWCCFFVKYSTLLVHVGFLAFLKPVADTTYCAGKGTNVCGVELLLLLSAERWCALATKMGDGEESLLPFEMVIFELWWHDWVKKLVLLTVLNLLCKRMGISIQLSPALCSPKTKWIGFLRFLLVNLWFMCFSQGKLHSYTNFCLLKILSFTQLCKKLRS